jgi:hypothetical protein
VVVTALAVGTTPTRNARFERDAVAGFERGYIFTHLDDLSGALVAEDERIFDDVLPDTAVFVVVNVRSTDTDVADGHEDVVWTRRRLRTVLQFELVRLE